MHSSHLPARPEIDGVGFQEENLVMDSKENVVKRSAEAEGTKAGSGSVETAPPPASLEPTPQGSSVRPSTSGGRTPGGEKSTSAEQHESKVSLDNFDT